MINLILFGKPGCGKGTQAEFIKNKYDLVHISTGIVFRHNISMQTELGLIAKSYMDKGDLVPDNVTIKMLEAEVNKFPNVNGFIFDTPEEFIKLCNIYDNTIIENAYNYVIRYHTNNIEKERYLNLIINYK